MVTIKNDGHYSKAYDNDLSTRTTNHIYLHPGHHSGEFENWMRKIGGLLQIGSEATHLKPLFNLLVSVIEPERIFLYTFPEISENRIKAYTEVLLLVDTERNNQVDALNGFIKLACYKYHDVMISLRTTSHVTDLKIDDMTGYEILHFREDFLIFSNSPYRLNVFTKEQLHESYAKVLRLFIDHHEKATKGFEMAKLLLEQKQTYQAYVFLTSMMEQLYNAIIYAFDPLYSYYVGVSLSQLRTKASTYLPQLFATDNRSDKIIELSLYLSDRNRFSEEYLVEHFIDCFEIADELFSSVKPCFELKLNYLFNRRKGEITSD